MRVTFFRNDLQKHANTIECSIKIKTLLYTKRAINSTREEAKTEVEYKNKSNIVQNYLLVLLWAKHIFATFMTMPLDYTMLSLYSSRENI